MATTFELRRAFDDASTTANDANNMLRAAVERVAKLTQDLVEAQAYLIGKRGAAEQAWASEHVAATAWLDSARADIDKQAERRAVSLASIVVPT